MHVSGKDFLFLLVSVGFSPQLACARRCAAVLGETLESKIDIPFCFDVVSSLFRPLSLRFVTREMIRHDGTSRLSSHRDDPYRLAFNDTSFRAYIVLHA